MSDAIERTVAEGGSQAAPAAGHEITRQQERYAVPPVDIYEKEDALTVIADLPGVSASGLSVHVEQGVLTISGKVDVDPSMDLLRREFELTSFYRQFRISETIDTEKIQATLKDGVLCLTLPKVERAKPRQIPVEAS